MSLSDDAARKRAARAAQSPQDRAQDAARKRTKRALQSVVPANSSSAESSSTPSGEAFNNLLKYL